MGKLTDLEKLTNFVVHVQLKLSIMEVLANENM